MNPPDSGLAHYIHATQLDVLVLMLTMRIKIKASVKFGPISPNISLRLINKKFQYSSKLYFDA
jgi:hypothetical protein